MAGHLPVAQSLLEMLSLLRHVATALKVACDSKQQHLCRQHPSRLSSHQRSCVSVCAVTSTYLGLCRRCLQATEKVERYSHDEHAPVQAFPSPQGGALASHLPALPGEHPCSGCSTESPCWQFLADPLPAAQHMLLPTPAGRTPATDRKPRLSKSLDMRPNLLLTKLLM